MVGDQNLSHIIIQSKEDNTHTASSTVYHTSRNDDIQNFRFLLQKTYNPSKQRGLVDVFLGLQYKNGEKHLTDEQVMGLVLDAIGGGQVFFLRLSSFCFLFVSYLCLAKYFLDSHWQLKLTEPPTSIIIRQLYFCL